MQDETFFVASTGRFAPTSEGYTASERESILGHRWWSLAELRATSDDVWPRELADLLEPILVDGPAALRELPDAFEDPGNRPPGPSRGSV